MPLVEHIIINQIKNIGDVVLCLPIASLLKKALPNCKITLLAQPYTFPIASQCNDIDSMIDWNSLEKKDPSEIIEAFRNLKATAIIHLSNNKKIAKYAYKAGIEKRVGTSQRLYHWRYCNRRINQARRHSTLHELQLNAQMLIPLNIKGIKKNYNKKELIEKMNLCTPNKNLPKEIEDALRNEKNKIILHPGSNGHGREWPIQHYISLAKQLNKKGHQIIITGSKNEELRFKPLTSECSFALNTMGLLSLEELMVLIDASDLLLASGTGPIHISAALNKATIGLFPPRKGISPRRWSPPGNKVKTLMHQRNKPCFSCRESEGCACMMKIRVIEVIAAIEQSLS